MLFFLYCNIYIICMYLSSEFTRWLKLKSWPWPIVLSAVTLRSSLFLLHCLTSQVVFFFLPRGALRCTRHPLMCEAHDYCFYANTTFLVGVAAALLWTWQLCDLLPLDFRESECGKRSQGTQRVSSNWVALLRWSDKRSTQSREPARAGWRVWAGKQCQC